MTTRTKRRAAQKANRKAVEKAEKRFGAYEQHTEEARRSRVPLMTKRELILYTTVGDAVRAIVRVFSRHS